MKFELKDFQTNATRSLLDRMLKARDCYYRDRSTASCCLAAPTGSGKTIMVAAAIEALFNGNPEWGIERDPKATVLWVSNSPALNEQTIYRFREATDLDKSLIETIENTFTSDHDILEPGHIYFLNRQKLSSAGLLTKGGEVPRFWDLLRKTVNSSSVHLFMLYDEAHKGLGSAAKTDTAGETITSKIIDGEDGKSPIPVVVGISATPKRFLSGMASRNERVGYPIVKVKPADVQASGLLKDKIILQAPTQGAAVYNMYLTAACKTLKDSTIAWRIYCEKNDLRIVRPLMVVQVPDKVSREKIREICVAIYEKIGDKIPDFSRQTSFAHVMSGEGDINLDSYNIPHVEPQDVQRNDDILILFAKEAISTGWDCPRAEVIFSMRPHKDDTYIAQLVGRMVRTPLAESAEMESLNSVSCFLPLFDPDTLDSVVKYLTEEGNDDFSGISAESGREIITKPVDVKWDSSFGVDNVFTGIATHTRAHATSDHIGGLISYTGTLDSEIKSNPSVIKQLERFQTHSIKTDGPIGTTDDSSTTNQEHETQVNDEVDHRVKTPDFNEEADPGEGKKALDIMLRALNDAILTYKEKFEEAKTTVLHAKSTKYEFEYLNADSVKKQTFEDEADAYAINNARRRADVTLAQAVTNRYFSQQYARGIDIIDINAEIAAAAAVPEIVNAVKQRAKSTLETLTKQYDPLIPIFTPNSRAKIASGMSRHGIPHTIFLTKPESDIHDANGKQYPKHLINDPKTHMAWFKLNESEDTVVMNELKKPNIKCWYRNPNGERTGSSLRIEYRIGRDDRKSLHPDFIFFEEIDGRIMPAIVDPHGIQFSDFLPKLKGVIDHIEKFGDFYSRYWAVTDYDNQATYLDMKDAEVREVVRKATDIHECLKKCGKKYMDGPLSKSKDGFRKK